MDFIERAAYRLDDWLHHEEVPLPTLDEIVKIIREEYERDLRNAS